MSTMDELQRPFKQRSTATDLLGKESQEPNDDRTSIEMRKEIKRMLFLHVITSDSFRKFIQPAPNSIRESVCNAFINDINAVRQHRKLIVKRQVRAIAPGKHRRPAIAVRRLEAHQQRMIRRQGVDRH